MAINSKNITEEFRTICDEIQKHYPGTDATDWAYRIPFRVSSIRMEDLTKASLFGYLDECMEKVRAFEVDLTEKLQQNSIEEGTGSQLK